MAFPVGYAVLVSSGGSIVVGLGWLPLQTLGIGAFWCRCFYVHMIYVYIYIYRLTHTHIPGRPVAQKSGLLSFNDVFLASPTPWMVRWMLARMPHLDDVP